MHRTAFTYAVVVACAGLLVGLALSGTTRYTLEAMSSGFILGVAFQLAVGLAIWKRIRRFYR